jgi:hypothetical protein
LERTGANLISVVDATVKQLLRRPRYYRALLLVLVGSESADPARRHVEHALARQITAGLLELDATGELASWVDRRVLARQLHSQLDMSCLEWARGIHSASSFRASARFGIATTLLGLTPGSSHAAFDKVARESQTQACRPRARGSVRGYAA